MALTLVTAPMQEPLSLDEAKLQVRRTDTREDAFLQDLLIPAVRDRAELYTQRQLLTATWRLTLDDWPREGWIDVPRAPLQSVTSITYVDVAGVTQTLATSVYVVDAPAGPRAPRGRIALAYGQVWPSLRSQLNAVTVTFVSGYGADKSSVPALLRNAMLRDLASLYEHREDVITGTIAVELPASAASVYRSFKSRPLQRRAA